MKTKLKQFLQGEVKSVGDIFSGIASSGREDRDGDTINPNGWDLTAYKQNPIMLWGHNPYNPPVGKAFNLRIEGGQLRFDFTMANTPMGQELKTLIKDGYLNTFSVGFIPRAFGSDLGGQGQYTFQECELLEISLVSIPSNVDAMVTSRSFQGMSHQTKQFVLNEIKRMKTIVDHGPTSFPEVKEYTWDEEAERRGAELDSLKAMSTYVDDEAPNDKLSYKLLHHTSGKEYPLVKEALDLAIERLGELPEEVRDAAYEHLSEHYQELGLEAPTKSAAAEKGVKPGPSKSEEQVVTVELDGADRELLKRVADNLEKANMAPIEKTPEAKKVDRSGRDVDRKAYANKIMIRALQITVKSISKRLHELKK